MRAVPVMRSASFIHRFVLALALSTVALTVAVVIQGAFVFPQHFRTLGDPVQTDILQFSLVADGQQSIALLRHSSRTLPHELRCTLQLCELAERKFSSRSIDLDFMPWAVASARGAEQVFIGSTDGSLWCFGLAAPALQPRLLGIHPTGIASVVACTHDGSMLFAANLEGSSAWSRERATCHWQRSDIAVVGAHFHGPTSRLFCGLNTGPCVELDRFTGEIVRTCDSRSEGAISLDVSSDGRYLATLRFHGLCVVTDLEGGRELWSKQFPYPGVGPRFSPDGQFVLTAAAARTGVLNVLAAKTGEPLTELHGAKAEIAGIEVMASGIVYAWDKAGTLTAWELATRTLLRQYNITSGHDH